MHWRGPEDAEVLARLMSDRYFQYFMKKLEGDISSAVSAALSPTGTAWNAGYAAALQNLMSSFKNPSSGAK